MDLTLDVHQDFFLTTKFVEMIQETVIYQLHALVTHDQIQLRLIALNQLLIVVVPNTVT